jgi:hypothetical protein
VPSDGYDYLSIMTHEAGHFLGLAHSADEDATMFARYLPGRTKMRDLMRDDVEGICAVYPPTGIRNVDPSIDAGVIPASECDPAPRRRFLSECRPPEDEEDCAVHGGPGRPSRAYGVVALGLFVGALLARRRAARSS